MFDILIVGGGINGAGILRDAAGRGLKIGLIERNEIGSATSSWSSKLIHGGLRYLENYDFFLVRKSLKEREVILKIAETITQPIPFIIPHSSNLRPSWIIRLGLFFYDHLGGKISLPKSKYIKINNELQDNPLKEIYTKGYQYYDVKVDDRELVRLNIKDGVNNGAKIWEHTNITSANRYKDFWEIELNNKEIIRSKILINATGPWVIDFNKNVLKIDLKRNIRLVKGSHIIVNKIFSDNYALTLQNKDKRIIFIIPYKKNFSLIGTTEKIIENPDEPKISQDEIDYLIYNVNKYLKKPLNQKDIIDTYSGVRPIIEKTNFNTSKATRDYAIEANYEGSYAPLLTIFGGKLTTYRKLAEDVLDELQKKLIYKNLNKWTHLKALK